jgi:hypothetical protein
VSGARQPTLAERLVDPKTKWQRITVAGWYGRTERPIELISGIALWHHPGKRVPIRWVLVRDGAGKFEPQGFLCTDPDADPLDVLRWFVRRWSVEVTFAEVRRHLGVETQRQWSDLGIARTTPALLGLFSLVTLWAKSALDGDLRPQRAAWFPSSSPPSAMRLPPSATVSEPRRLSPPHPTIVRSSKPPVGCWNVLPRPPATQPEWPKSS